MRAADDADDWLLSCHFVASALSFNDHLGNITGGQG
jgi:hypothetical protein